jgi:hypothetical protein
MGLLGDPEFGARRQREVREKQREYEKEYQEETETAKAKGEKEAAAAQKAQAANEKKWTAWIKEWKTQPPDMPDDLWAQWKERLPVDDEWSSQIPVASVRGEMLRNRTNPFDNVKDVPAYRPLWELYEKALGYMASGATAEQKEAWQKRFDTMFDKAMAIVSKETGMEARDRTPEEKAEMAARMVRDWMGIREEAMESQFPAPTPEGAQGFQPPPATTGEQIGAQGQGQLDMTPGQRQAADENAAMKVFFQAVQEAVAQGIPNEPGTASPAGLAYNPNMSAAEEYAYRKINAGNP